MLSIQEAGPDPILSAGWVWGTQEKDVSNHSCRSTSPNPSDPEGRTQNKACVWPAPSLKACVGSTAHFLRTRFQAGFLSVGRISQKLPLASTAEE